MSVEVEGTEALRRKIAAVRQETRDAQAFEVKRALMETEEAARAMAPRGAYPAGGELKASMFHEVFSNDISGQAGSRGTDHARHVHFGRRATATNKGTEAVPYLFAPFEAIKKRYLRRLRRTARAAYRRLSNT